MHSGINIAYIFNINFGLNHISVYRVDKLNIYDAKKSDALLFYGNIFFKKCIYIESTQKECWFSRYGCKIFVNEKMHHKYDI